MQVVSCCVRCTCYQDDFPEVIPASTPTQYSRHLVYLSVSPTHTMVGLRSRSSTPTSDLRFLLLVSTCLVLATCTCCVYCTTRIGLPDCSTFHVNFPSRKMSTNGDKTKVIIFGIITNQPEWEFNVHVKENGVVADEINLWTNPHKTVLTINKDRPNEDPWPTVIAQHKVVEMELRLSGGVLKVGARKPGETWHYSDKHLSNLATTLDGSIDVSFQTADGLAMYFCPCRDPTGESRCTDTGITVPTTPASTTTNCPTPEGYFWYAVVPLATATVILTILLIATHYWSGTHAGQALGTVHPQPHTVPQQGQAPRPPGVYCPRSAGQVQVGQVSALTSHESENSLYCGL